MVPAGRLADPAACLASDPRSDPRMVAALEPLGLAVQQEPSPVPVDAPLAERLLFAGELEQSFQALFADLTAPLEPPPGVGSEPVVIRGADGGEISLTVHRPEGLKEAAPCVVHLHGGGMAVLAAADPVFTRWREGLAATGMVVVGVEFRNCAGKLGPHPYPAGLDDCAAAVRWTASNAAELGASHVILSGESGGGNLALAAAIRAKREGWDEEISGVYAQCPFISGAYASPPEELVSLLECDGYFLATSTFATLASLYDPELSHSDDPACWPLRAGPADLEGIPPHAISVNELDPLRDEGLAYHRLLEEAGVEASARVVPGTCHAADVLLGVALPDVRSESLEEVSRFARSVAPARAG